MISCGHIIGIKPQFENIISNGPFIPMAVGQRNPEGQWTADERKAANLDKRLKSLNIDCWSKTSVPSYQSPFQPKLLHSSEHKLEPRRTKYFEAKYNKVKAKLALLSSSALAPSLSSGKNKDNSEVSITGSNKPKLSETEDSTLLNHDTGKVPSNESQRNITDHSAVVFDSLATDYDSADESLVCSTPLPPLENLTSAEPVSGPKTIKSILKSKYTFKAETLKGITINEPSSAPARGNKSSPVSKSNSALAGKLKNVKIEDDPPFAILMKELNELKLQISKNKSSYFRNKNSQQIPSNALQNKYKTQFKMNRKLCGQNNHLSENCYEFLFCKKCKRTNHRTCDHANFMSSMDINQYRIS
ncbi:hypothetical protein Tco_0628661 [Tanacetum coccineum]|uniref:Uncharacterized protein n=1 Tax=Tanacetum coccineum TaxID=301880 RepID=A0ABQ4WQY4_9ASTR